MDETDQKQRLSPTSEEHDRKTEDALPIGRRLLVAIVFLISGCVVGIRVYHALERTGPPRVTRHLASPLKPMPTEPPIETWYERLHGPDKQSQRDAISHLVNVRPITYETADALMDLLNDEELRLDVVDALGELGFKAYQAAETLDRMARGATGASEQQRVTAALLRIDPFRVVELPDDFDATLVVLLRHPDHTTRQYAAFCLGARRSQLPAAESALLAELNSGGIDFYAAQLALSQIQAKRYRPSSRVLFQKMRSSNWNYVVVEQLALAEVRPSELIDVLVARSEWDIRGPLQSLVKRWGKAAVPSCIIELQSTDPSRAEYAALILKELETDAAGATLALTELAVKRANRARRYSLEALQAIGPDARDAINDLDRLFATEASVELATTLYCIDPTEDRLCVAWGLIAPLLPRKENDFDHDSTSDLLALRPAPVELLIEVLEKSPREGTRYAVADALIDNVSRLEHQVPRLAALLDRPPQRPSFHHEDQLEPARLSAEVLAAMGPTASSATQQLIQALNSTDVHTRKSVIHALSQVARRETASEIIRAIQPISAEAGVIDFAIRRIAVTCDEAVNDLPEDLKEDISSITPRGNNFVSYGLSPTLNVDAAQLVPRIGTLANLLAVSESWQRVSSDDVREQILAVGEGGESSRSAVPLLLWMLQQEKAGELHGAIIHAIWRLTRSPLVMAVMADSGVYPFETIRQIGPEAVCIAPHLVNWSDMLLIPLLGPRAREALPELRGVLKGSDGGTDAMAGLVIWRIEHDPSVVPQLIRQLKSDRLRFIQASPGIDSRKFVALALGGIGPPAKDAIPLLAEAAYLDSGEFGRASAWAIVQIDPQAASEWGITDSAVDQEN